ncbi:histidine kinase [Slackia equolifaciens]|uniref:histidine kinase n=1 Tax=Slackia equolifaciens TaxID=498718 RepID=A0A3N0B0X5_9ACTN|nr:DUF3365 domain-containing protein [Slackia equolifaciens]RNL40578.1 histidine kinase [Slackia equolifaciens]
MKNISLKTIYLSALTAVFLVALAMFAVFDLNSQREQAESAMLEEARTFAREMDAVWQFMDNSQDKINYTSDGTYEFKGLHCAVVGKSVGAIFSAGSDYAIRYVNLEPRNYQGTPDAFETEALNAFNADHSVTEQYGIAEYEGEERFRYVQALEVDESCLECHGDPVGEIDKTGHAKEGWTLDSVGGAISIVLPTDMHVQDMWENFIRDCIYFLLIALVIGGVVWVITSMFVFRPLNRMKLAFGEMQGGSLKVTLDDTRTAKEIGRVMRGFNSMAGELRSIYANLEEEVGDRTRDLTRANEALERQRDDLARLNQKLEQETEFKSNLLSMVNHELRTPLTSIITFAQLSRESCEGGQEGERAKWEEIEKNAQILLRMINDMLDMARSDSGNISASCEPVDLGDVVASVKSTMAPLAKKYQVGFSTSVAPDVPLVMGDYEKIARMLENLGSNAIKFTPDGGSVRLTVEYNAASDSVSLKMADTGIGIASEDQTRIFDKFFQVDSTSTRKYNGSGLGLALVREYAQLQGYSVRVQSELGCGSTFTVEIPKEAIVGDDDV